MTRSIAKLSNSTAFGLDCIDAVSLKLAASQLILPLKHLVNTSLKHSSYATKWKTAKVIPLLKSNDLNRLDPASYRPVAILPVFSKLVERSAQLQLLEFLERTNQLNPSAHAYRQCYSTMTTLIEVTNKLYEAMENRQFSSVMTVDQTAAFDCVTHDILLDKLKLYKLGGKALKWMENYLNGRSQLVNIGRAHSRTVALSRGVPQGSVLGPLLYSVYTNKMTECIQDPACRNSVHNDPARLFDKQCSECGCI